MPQKKPQQGWCWGLVGDRSQMCIRPGKIYDWKRSPRDWLILLTVVAVIATPQTSGAADDITGTVPQTEPTIKQDGTPAHPYANDTQCPAKTDIIIWPSGRSVPSLPPSISVCFVGNQPVEISGAIPVQMRDPSSK